MLSKAFYRSLASVAALACVGIIAGSTGFAPAQAGTTGMLSGQVVDAQSLAVLPDVGVTAASPSQTVTTKTNADGKFVFLSLMPDTYTVSIHGEGYEPREISGISIYADQAQNMSFSIQKSVRTIGTVTVRSSLNVVRPGTITDVYSVSPAQTLASAPLGGGGSLNQAYAAIASMRGALVPP